MATRKLAAPAGGGAPADSAPEAEPATAPTATRYRVLCGTVVFPARTASFGDVVELSETDVANMLPLGVIEPVTE